MKTIGERAFDMCLSLECADIPNGVTSIGEAAFLCCFSINEISIPESIAAIGKEAFFECPSLEKITVSDKNQNYDSREGCNAIIDSKTNDLIVGCKNTDIPIDIVSIGDGAFASVESITDITIPEGVKSIGNSAFFYCIDMINITIPESVESIGDMHLQVIMRQCQ